jgi:hypothetical protein
VVAFSLILFDRSDRVYLWMGALFLLLAVQNALTVIGSWTEVQSSSINNLLADALDPADLRRMGDGVLGMVRAAAPAVAAPAHLRG